MTEIETRATSTEVRAMSWSAFLIFSRPPVIWTSISESERVQTHTAKRNVFNYAMNNSSISTLMQVVVFNEVAIFNEVKTRTNRDAETTFSPESVATQCKQARN